MFETNVLGFILIHIMEMLCRLLNDHDGAEGFWSFGFMRRHRVKECPVDRRI